MEIPVSCACGKSFRAKAALAGKTVACPSCKKPLTIPAGGTASPASPAPAQSAPSPARPAAAQPAPAQPSPAVPQNPATVQPVNAPAQDIVVGCACGQQFTVQSQFAGQQCNCPACNQLCNIPAAGSAPAPQPQFQQPQPVQPPAPMQPQAPQPGYPVPPANPMQQPPGYGQPAPPYGMPQQPPGIAPGPMGQPGYPQQPGYDQSYAAPYASQDFSYGGRRAHKTGIGIFIFAIATCVFAGGYGAVCVSEGITELRGLMLYMNAKAQMRRIKEGKPINTGSRNSAQLGNTLNSMTELLLKVGEVAVLMALIATVVAAVFSVMSPDPLFGLGIAQICVSAGALIMFFLFETMPILSTGFNSFSYNFTTDIRMIMLSRIIVGVAFLLYCIFVMKAASRKKNRQIEGTSRIGLIGFSVGAGVYLLLLFITFIDIRPPTSEAGGITMIVFFVIVHWVAHAGMLTGSAMLIRSGFDSKRIYKVG